MMLFRNKEIKISLIFFFFPDETFHMFPPAEPGSELDQVTI